MAAIQANRSDSHPPTFDSDIAGLDVSLSDSGLPLPPSGLDAIRAKVVGLEFHLRYTIIGGVFLFQSFFSENESKQIWNCFNSASKNYPLR